VKVYSNADLVELSWIVLSSDSESIQKYAAVRVLFNCQFAVGIKHVDRESGSVQIMAGENAGTHVSKHLSSK